MIGLGVAFLALLAAPAEEPVSEPAPAEPAPLETIIVTARRIDASGQPAILVYDAGYFRPFEPTSVGDLLARVPGVAFSADSGEHGAPQLRGLAAPYTRVLINGKPVPGSNTDRSVDVDRIPAELVERIEIARSPTASLGSEGIGGTINIVLKDAASEAGGVWRLAGLHYPDADSGLRGAGMASYGWSVGRRSHHVAVSVEEQLVPKSKVQAVFDPAGELQQIVPSRDVRDSVDYSVAASLEAALAPERRLELAVNWNRNDAAERERVEVRSPDGGLDEIRMEREDIGEQRTEVRVGYEAGMGSGRWSEVTLVASRVSDGLTAREGLVEDGTLLTDFVDVHRDVGRTAEVRGAWHWRRDDRDRAELGLDLVREERAARRRVLERDEDELVDTTPGNGTYTVDETRVAAYVQDERRPSPAIRVVYGLRAEHTELDQAGQDGRSRESYLDLIPSGHLVYQLYSGFLRLSVARTLRRPRFDEIVPFTTRDTPNENQVTVGNPELEPERAWGLDLGYEHPLAAPGVLGINFFYRDVGDKVELTRIAPGVYAPANVGSGRAWGLEFDAGGSLAPLGLPDVAATVSYAWLDSEIDDPLTGEQRRFNLQPRYVGSLDLIHSLPGAGVRYGLSFQRQGRSRDVQLGEIASLDYEGNLKLFFEKSLVRGLVLRVTADNLLDATKREETLLFSGLDELREGAAEERILETEEASPVFQLTLRGRF